jgi:ATP-dependent Clp protease ATP-binding subunit ClpA
LKLIARRRRMPRAKTIGPAGPYLARGAEEARRLGHGFIGTEHVLLVLARDREGGAMELLRRLGVDEAALVAALACWLPTVPGQARIDREALAALGVDLDTVRERLEQAFGPNALEQTRSGCLGISPRLKLALAHALDRAAGTPLADEHVLLGLLEVPGSVASRVLGELGVTLDLVESRAAA